MKGRQANYARLIVNSLNRPSFCGKSEQVCTTSAEVLHSTVSLPKIEKKGFKMPIIGTPFTISFYSTLTVSRCTAAGT